MASMSRNERALSYVKRIKEASNLREEALKILNEIDGLVWSKDSKPLPLDEKVAIIQEVKQILLRGEKKGDTIIIKASDNSGLIDVIDSIENDLKSRNK